MKGPVIIISPITQAEAIEIVEGWTGMSHFEATRCEWDPVAREPSEIGKGCRRAATVSVGSRNSIHLCASCASLPEFRRYRVRRPLA
jgi:hypothetical protein